MSFENNSANSPKTKWSKLIALSQQTRSQPFSKHFSNQGARSDSQGSRLTCKETLLWAAGGKMQAPISSDPKHEKFTTRQTRTLLLKVCESAFPILSAPATSFRWVGGSGSKFLGSCAALEWPEKATQDSRGLRTSKRNMTSKLKHILKFHRGMELNKPHFQSTKPKLKTPLRFLTRRKCSFEKFA